jgi:hypothetical protein|tara:strand:- start:386 stop:712 length:327 start_codon:yes stop_codon:yes gene_type:complete
MLSPTKAHGVGSWPRVPNRAEPDGKRHRVDIVGRYRRNVEQTQENTDMSEPTNADKNQAVGLLDEATKLVTKARRLLQEPDGTHLSNVVLMLALRSEEVSMDLLGYGA